MKNQLQKSHATVPLNGRNLKSESETPCFSIPTSGFWQNLELHGHKKLPQLEMFIQSKIVDCEVSL